MLNTPLLSLPDILIGGSQTKQIEVNPGCSLLAYLVGYRV